MERKGLRVNIEKTTDGGKLTIALEGRLDTVTAPRLEAEIKNGLAGVAELEFDFSRLEYLSSAGLRVLLSARKIMNRQGTMVVRHANETIREVFEITGFSDFLTVEA